MTQTFASAATSAAPVAGRLVVTGRLALLATREFLTFRLGAQEYGIDVAKVREIRGCGWLASMDDAPELIRGAIDLGGVRVPIVDLRKRLGLERAAGSMFTVAIILNVDERVLGVMVDSVSDVIRLACGQIHPAPVSGPHAQCLIGIGVDDDRRLILLDMEELLLGEGMGLLEVEAY